MGTELACLLQTVGRHFRDEDLRADLARDGGRANSEATGAEDDDFLSTFDFPGLTAGIDLRQCAVGRGDGLARNAVRNLVHVLVGTDVVMSAECPVEVWGLVRLSRPARVGIPAEVAVARIA